MFHKCKKERLDSIELTPDLYLMIFGEVTKRMKTKEKLCEPLCSIIINQITIYQLKNEFKKT